MLDYLSLLLARPASYLDFIKISHLSHLFDLFLQVPHAALPAVPLDETVDGVRGYGQLGLTYTSTVTCLRYQVPLRTQTDKSP